MILHPSLSLTARTLRAGLLLKSSLACCALLLGLLHLAGPMFAAEDGGKLEGFGFAIEAPIVLSTAPRLVLAKGRILMTKGGAAEQKAFKGGVPANWAQRVIEEKLSHLRLDDAELTLDLRGTTVTNEILPHFQALLKDSWISKLTIHNSRITVLRAGQAPINLPLNEARFEMDLDDGDISGSGRVTLFRQETAFKLDADFPLTSTSPAEASSLALTITHPLFSLTFDGGISPAKGLSLEGELALKLMDQVSLTIFNHAFTDERKEASKPPVTTRTEAGSLSKDETALNRPIDQPGEVLFEAAGNLSWVGAAGTLRDGVFRLGANRSTGSLSLKLSEKNDKISGTMAFKRLDLEALLSAIKLNGFIWQEKNEGMPNELKAGIEKIIRIIRHFDADLRVSAKEVVFGPVVLKDTGFSLYQNEGVLIVDVAETMLFDGQAAGHFKIDTHAPKPRWHINSQLDNIDLSAAAQLMTKTPRIEGRGTIKVHLTSFGDKLTEILPNMFGAVIFNMPEGGNIGFDLTALLSAPTDAARQAFELFSDGSTGFDSLETIGHIARGGWTTEFFSLRAKPHEFTGNGHYNFEKKLMDWHIAAWPLPDNIDAVDQATDKPDRAGEHVAPPLMISCSQISGRYGALLLETYSAMHLSLLNRGCPAVYRRPLKKHQETIVPE